ncbi:MAG: hypothetical protein AAF378_24615, partial [Cyanobacteria bacterium P01_A01_bin.84]
QIDFLDIDRQLLEFLLKLDWHPLLAPHPDRPTAAMLYLIEEWPTINGTPIGSGGEQAIGRGRNGKPFLGLLMAMILVSSFAALSPCLPRSLY